MGNQILEKHFGALGARVKVTEIAIPNRRFPPGIDGCEIVHHQGARKSDGFQLVLARCGTKDVAYEGQGAVHS